MTETSTCCVLSASAIDNKIAWYENLHVDRDFGDAPSPYPTQLVDNGAYHDAVGPRLGASRDSEPDGQPDDGSDEDGVMFGTIQVGATTAGVNVDVQNVPSAHVEAWVDFDGNGTWDADEKIIDDVVVNNVGGFQTLNFNVNADTLAGETYARVRVSSAGALDATGPADDGEVEDYFINILPVAPQVENVLINNNDPTRSKITSLTVRFDTELDHAAIDSAFTITNITTGTQVGMVNVSATDHGGKTSAALTFTGASTIAPRPAQAGILAVTLADGNYRLDIASAQVKLSSGNFATMPADDVFGGQLKAAPSNDNFFRLYGDDNGDDNGDGFTDFSDFAVSLLPAFGSENGVGTNYNESLDGNGDGFVDFTDFANDFLPRFGTERP